ncbi:MAG: hypothetical protein JXR07_03815 [Reichenbachiella sp.]
MTLQWQLLTFPSIADIVQAREQCHQAIQNVSAVGRSFLPESKEDVNANLEWDSKLQRLVGRWVETEDITFRSSISISEMTVYLVDRKFETISSIALQDKTQTDIMIWLEHQLGELGFESSKINLAYPYQIPEYATAKGQPFQVTNMVACRELSRLYNNTSLLIQKHTVKEENHTSVKCWPHHFDIAGQIILQDTGDPATSRSIGVGMSPGDKYYIEPYFYVSPWPYPTKDLPNLDRTLGHWHTDDWIGGVLPVSKLADFDLIQDQRGTLDQFYKLAIDGLKNLL